MTTPHIIRLAALVFAAVSLVVLGDTAGKLLTSGGVDPFVVGWTRFALAALVLLPFSGLRLAELSVLRDWRVLARASFIAPGICCILTALQTEPIANVFGAFFIGPVVSYILAILFLGETPSRGRSALLALGFLGVMLVVKPGFGASAGGCYGAYLAMTRTVAGDYRPRLLLMSQLMIGAVLLTPLGLGADWPGLTLPVLALIGLSAFGSAAGNYLLVVANRQAEASLIAPLVYTQLISATLAGIWVFGDWPDAVALLGLVLIAVSGFGTLAFTRSAARSE
jgi:drug/metabolite transporter (DMT)-like permease